MPPADPPTKQVAVTREGESAVQAMSVSHRRVRILAGVRLLVSAIVAFVGAVVTLKSISTAWITIIGAIWACVNSVFLTLWAEAELLRAAKLQEQFELDMFKLSWNEVLAGSKVRSADRKALSDKFRGSIDDDWNQMPAFPRPFDVLARQLENLAWGGRVHRRYAIFLAIVIASWGVAGVAVGGVEHFTVARIVTGWYIPALGALLFGLESARQQWAVAKERLRVGDFAEKGVLDAAGRLGEPTLNESLSTLSRQLQDVMFRTRSRAPRVPKIFFRLRSKLDEKNCRESTRNLRDALAVNPLPLP